MRPVCNTLCLQMHAYPDQARFAPAILHASPSRDGGSRRRQPRGWRRPFRVVLRRAPWQGPGDALREAKFAEGAAHVSQSDSFIDEVTEEVRRDRLFALMRRYGWIAVLAVLLLVGGAAWNEWRKAQERQAARAFGDSVLGALERDGQAERAAALESMAVQEPGRQIVLRLLTAAEQPDADHAAAARALLDMADREGVLPVYRQIAVLKAVAMPDSDLSPETKRQHLDGLTLAGGLVRLLAEEQLALLALESGDRQGALERLQQIAADAEATAGLRRRATQLIVALGGEVPENAGTGSGNG